MDGKVRALDNIFAERLWRTIKYEEVYLHSHEAPRNARRGLSRYLAFYNRERPHQALGDSGVPRRAAIGPLRKATPLPQSSEARRPRSPSQ